MVPLPNHAETTVPGPDETSPIPPIQFDFEQKVLTCATANETIYYDVEICNTSEKPFDITQFVDSAKIAATSPEITLNAPTLPYRIGVGSCVTFKFSAYSKDLNFQCHKEPIIWVDFDLDKSQLIAQVILSLNPDSYTGEDPDNGTATSTPPTQPPEPPPVTPPPVTPPPVTPPPVTPPPPAVPPSKPPPVTPPPDTATSTLRAFRK